MNLSTYFELMGRGSSSHLTEAIGAYTSDMSNWTNGVRPVPVKFAVLIEQETKGQVTRQDLRPDDFDEIWPDLKKPPVTAQ